MHAFSCDWVQLMSFIDLCAAYGTRRVHIAACGIACYVTQTFVAHFFVATRQDQSIWPFIKANCTFDPRISFFPQLRLAGNTN